MAGWRVWRGRTSSRVICHEVTVPGAGSEVPDQQTVTCVIPGHDRQGRELVVDELHAADAGPLAFRYEGVCAYASTFEYSGS
jgi:hypothetical protein